MVGPFQLFGEWDLDFDQGIAVLVSVELICDANADLFQTLRSASARTVNCILFLLLPSEELEPSAILVVEPYLSEDSFNNELVRGERQGKERMEGEELLVGAVTASLRVTCCDTVSSGI